jgi:hypothetical protein
MMAGKMRIAGRHGGPPSLLFNVNHEDGGWFAMPQNVFWIYAETNRQ